MNPTARIASTVTFLSLAGHATAEVIYSSLQNIAIPSTFDGVFVDVDGSHAPSSSSFSGWDINPFMGGKYLANSAAFQPARVGTDGMATVLNFGAGITIGSGLNFATGSGGSLDHLGNASGQFAASQDGYLAFKIGSNYGWMRVVFTNDTSGAVIKDWAYDTSGAPIVTGNVLQSAPTGGAQTVTLTSASGSFTLGSRITDTGGNANSVVKTGNGTAVLTGTNSYSGVTTVAGGTLLVNGSLTGAGTVTVGPAGTLGGTGGIAAAVMVNGILAPGTPGGSLSTGALALNNGSTFAYQMQSDNPVAADFLSVAGDPLATNLSLSGTVHLTLTDLAGAPVTYAEGTTLALIHYAGMWNGGFFTYGDNTLENHETFSDGRTLWQINYTASSGGLNVASGYAPAAGGFITLTAIPEPGNLAALGGVVAAGALLRVRRRGC